MDRTTEAEAPPGRAGGDRGRGVGGLSLGARFLLIVLVAVALPLGLAGAWLVRDAARAGEALLRSRMAGALDGLVRETGSRWVGLRSRVLDLAEDPRLQDALGAAGGAEVGPGRRSTGGTAEELAAVLASTHRELSEVLYEVVVREPGGGVVARLTWASVDGSAGGGGLGAREAAGAGSGDLPETSATSPAASPAAVADPWTPGLPVILDVRRTGSGELLGRLEARFRAEALLAGWAQWAARAGGVPAILDVDTGHPLVGPPFDPDLLERERFVLDGEAWITDRRTLATPPAVLVLASPLEPFTLPFREAARRGIVLILAVGLGGFAAAALLTVRTTRPMAELADAAEAVARGDLDARVEAEGPEEVARVGRAFNAMAGSLRRTLDMLAEREALAAVGEFAAGLAHEIRNPLTAMRLDLQRIEEVSGDDERRQALTDRMLAAARQLDRIVEGVLRAATAGRGPVGPVALGDVLARAARTTLPAYEARGAELVLPRSASGGGREGDARRDPGDGVAAPGGPPHMTVYGDGPALEQLFVNLLMNAAEAMEEEGGRATVEVSSEGGGVEIVVRDTGPGIPEDLRDRVLDPLFTTKPRGTGLGLAIARRIVRAHRGRLDMGDDPGGGARVTVWLPGDAAPAVGTGHVR